MAVKLPSYLFKNSYSIYYFRCVFPLPLQRQLQRREFKRSLRTSDRKLAIKVARYFKFRLDGVFKQVVERKMNWSETKIFLDGVAKDILDKFKAEIEEQGPCANVVDSYVEAFAELEAFTFLEMKLTDENHFEDFDRNTNEIVLREFTGDISSVVAIRKIANRIISDYGIEVPSGKYERFCTQVAEMLVKLYDDRENYLIDINAGVHYLNNQFSTNGSTESKLKSSACDDDISRIVNIEIENDSITFSELVDKFVDYKREGKGWNNQRTCDLNRQKLEFVNELICCIKKKKDVKLKELASSDVTFLEKWLRLLPANSKKRYPNIPLPELIAKSESGVIPASERITEVTYNGYAHLVMSMFKFAHSPRQKFVRDNYFIDMKIKESGDNKRPPFTEKDLKYFFNTDLFLGKYFKLEHAWRYWVPILMLYSGARVEEICQLRLSNIVDEFGIKCLDIKFEEDVKRAVVITAVKNASSKRMIPIHPKLKKIGFMDYVRFLQDKGEAKLFPSLSNITIDGGYAKAGAKVSKYFNEDSKHRHKKSYISRAGVNGEGKPRKVLYCFRHTVETLLDNLKKEVHFEKIDNILGHKIKTTGRGTYGGYEAPTLLRVVEKIDYPNASLPWDVNPDYRGIKFPWQK